MKLFNKIVHYMTGGSAAVEVDIDNANLDHPFKATVTADIKENDLKMDRVYLLIRCQDGKLDGYVEDESQMTDNERILQELNEWVIETLFKTDVEVAGEGELKAGNQYQWEVEVDLSAADKTTYKSEGHKIVWEVQAGIDVPGNDPDSGWVEFEVS